MMKMNKYTIIDVMAIQIYKPALVRAKQKCHDTFKTKML